MFHKSPIRMTSTALRVSLLGLILATAGATSVWAQATGLFGRILTQTGRVSVDNSGEMWALQPGESITAGQVLVTGADGYAQIELSDHSVIEVFPSSRLVFRPTRANWHDLVDIYLGKIRLQIQHLIDGETPYRVTSPSAVISIRGTVLDVEVGATNETTVEVETGLVGVRHRLLPGKEVPVATGQSVHVMPSIPLAAVRLTPRIVVAARIAKVAGETLARIASVTGKQGGSSGSSAPTSGPGAAAGSGGSSAGANAPAPAPGQSGSGNSKTPGDSSSNGGSSAPPGDVIK